MTDFTFSSNKFPAGTTVGAYLATSGQPHNQAPSGSPVDTSVVGSDSELTFEGLEADTRYWAYAEVSGDHRYVTFTTDPYTEIESALREEGIEIATAEYADDGSFQPVAADLNLAAGAGTSDSGDTSFLAAIMGNLIGAALSKTHNYLAGVIGALSATGTRGSTLQVGGLLGIIMDGVTAADGAVVAVIDGSDPSSETRATAAFAARQNNNNASSGVDYGVDLYDAGRDSTLFSGGGRPLAVSKAEVRFSSQVCLLSTAGAPSDGTTGDDFAEKGSLCIDRTNGKLYINTGTKASPVWTVVGTQS